MQRIAMVGDLEVAVRQFPSFAAQGTGLMSEIAADARLVAEDAIDQAKVRGVSSKKIAEAEKAREEGDSKLSDGKYKDAVAKYKDAASKAIGA